MSWNLIAPMRNVSRSERIQRGQPIMHAGTFGEIVIKILGLGWVVYGLGQIPLIFSF
jgi:hypothetical protein